MNAKKKCVVCGEVLLTGEQTWHCLCVGCGYESALLDQNINSATELHSMDEGLREEGLRSLRVQNFEILLRQIAAMKKNGGRLLDVGCAHGWFLDAANQKGFDVYGIEPDAHIVRYRLAKSHPVRLGYFPEVLDQSERFDLIVFNDVIEHIPNISDAVAACRHHLTNEGLLVLNLPDSQGIFYRLSKVFCRVGFVEFFNRMWQVGLPSPHVHYFNKRNLTKLLEQHGFKVIKSGHLATLHLSGLFARIAYAKGGKFRPLSILTFAAVLLAFPILKLLPGDILFVIAERDS